MKILGYGARCVKGKSSPIIFYQEEKIDLIQESGYNIGRMHYEIILAPEAVEDLKRLKAHVRAAVRDAIERYLRHEPMKESKSRIKRLRGIRQPQYRLRMDEIRIFYDVTENVVEILAIIPKSQAVSWLKEIGEGE